METAIRNVRLSGVLAARFGRVHRLAVRNVAEAIRALCITVPGFEKFMMESKDRGLEYVVLVGKKNVVEEELCNPVGPDDIKLYPVVQGAKRGVLQVIAGAVLVAVGVFVQWIGGGAPNPISNYLYGAGISMMVGGVVQMLSPVPKMKDGERKDEKQSYIFNGPVNVQAQGGSVPYFAGEMFVGSVVVSAGISVDDNYLVPTTGQPEDGYTKGDGMAGDYRENY